MKASKGTLFWAGAFSLIALTAALVSQHVYGMQPCPWCIAQRIAFAGIAAACLIGLVLPFGRMLFTLTAELLALTGAGMALWQHFGAPQSEFGCGRSEAQYWIEWSQLDLLLPQVFKPTASCADAAVDLMMIPYEFWSFGVFLVIAALLAHSSTQPKLV